MSTEITILGVDDDQLNLTILKLLVEKHTNNANFLGFSSVTDIKHFIEMNGEPDLIISDYQMSPGDENGADFSRWLIDRNFNRFIVWTDSLSIFVQKEGFTEDDNVEICGKSDFEKLKSFLLPIN